MRKKNGETKAPKGPKTPAFGDSPTQLATAEAIVERLTGVIKREDVVALEVTLDLASNYPPEGKSDKTISPARHDVLAKVQSTANAFLKALEKAGDPEQLEL